METAEAEEHNGQEEEEIGGGQLIRPTTLLGPEREQLRFQIPTLVGAPAEVVQLVQQIRNVAEQFLYHWNSFPIGRRMEREKNCINQSKSPLIYSSSSIADSSGSRPLVICFA